MDEKQLRAGLQNTHRLRRTVPADELTLARQLWPDLDAVRMDEFGELVANFGLSLSSGEVRLLNGTWYVTHAGLLGIATRKHCSGIHTETVSEFCDPGNNRWVVKATVFKTPRSKGFVGYGDADPSNVSPLVRGAELRIAETRAVNRALRKAYGIGLCSVEELGAGPPRIGPDAVTQANNPSSNGHSRLRDRLLLLIRQYKLDAESVKGYAAQFCGVSSLREASREQVEAFVNHITDLAAEDPEELTRKLAACAPPARPVTGAAAADKTDKEAA